MEIVEGIRSPFPERRRVEDLRSPSPRTRPHLGFVRYECYLVPALLLVVLAVVVPEAHNHGWKGALVALAGTAMNLILVVVSIGPAQAAETLRTGLAMGADRGILVKTDAIVEPLAVAKILKGVFDAEQPGLVILGKQAIDDDANQTGQMLAALTGRPQGAFASKVELGEGTVAVTREVDGGL